MKKAFATLRQGSAGGRVWRARERRREREPVRLAERRARERGGLVMVGVGSWYKSPDMAKTWRDYLLTIYLFKIGRAHV